MAPWSGDPLGAGVPPPQAPLQYCHPPARRRTLPQSRRSAQRGRKPTRKNYLQADATLTTPRGPGVRRRRGRPFRCRRHALLGLRAATAPPDRRGPCGSVLSLLWPCLLCSVLRSWYVSRGLSVLQSPTPPTIRPVLSESERPTDAWCAGWGRAGGVAPAAAGNCAPYFWPRKQLVPAPIDICKGAHLTIIPSPLPPPLPPPLSLSPPPLPPSLPPSLRPTLPPWPSLPSQPPTVPPTYPFNLLRLASW